MLMIFMPTLIRVALSGMLQIVLDPLSRFRKPHPLGGQRENAYSTRELAQINALRHRTLHVGVSWWVWLLYPYNYNSAQTIKYANLGGSKDALRPDQAIKSQF